MQKLPSSLWARDGAANGPGERQRKRPVDYLGSAGLLWAINGGRLLELHLPPSGARIIREACGGALRGVYIAVGGSEKLMLQSCFGKLELERLAEAGDEH